MNIAELLALAAIVAALVVGLISGLNRVESEDAGDDWRSVAAFTRARRAMRRSNRR